MKVYVLRSEKDESQYVGMRSDPERRLSEHNKGQVNSTKATCPWKIVLIESYDSRIEERKREKYLKSAAGRRFRKSLGM